MCRLTVLSDFYLDRALVSSSVNISTVTKSNCSTTCGKGIKQITTVRITGSSTDDFQVSNHISEETCQDFTTCPPGKSS